MKECFYYIFAIHDGIKRAPTPAHDSKTYDLQGRVVTAPRKGVYIRGGRKIVVR